MKGKSYAKEKKLFGQFSRESGKGRSKTDHQSEKRAKADLQRLKRSYGPEILDNAEELEE